MMPYLVQIHCDAIEPNGQPSMENGPQCLSFQCVQPTAMYEDAARAAKEVRDEAIETGWSYERLRWMCPEWFKLGRRASPVNLGGYRHGNAHPLPAPVPGGG